MKPEINDLLSFVECHLLDLKRFLLLKRESQGQDEEREERASRKEDKDDSVAFLLSVAVSFRLFDKGNVVDLN